MKPIILTVDQFTPGADTPLTRERFVIELDGLSGDLQIRGAMAPGCERDRSTSTKDGRVTLTVEDV